MKNIMFMTVGKRDLQRVYHSEDNKKVKRWEFILGAEHEFANYELVDPTDIREKGRDEKDLQKTNELCFPMFTKAMHFLKNNEVKKIDHLLLICTKRDQIQDKLKEISEYKNASENMRDYAKSLKDYAEIDKTRITASILKKCIEAKTLTANDIEITEVTILNLGSYGFLDPVLDIGEANPDILTILRRADINILDFFESELYNGLKPYFASLENSNIYLATYAGGMPLMQRALDIVLDSCLGYARFIRIFNSEHLSYQIESDPQDEFLSLLKKITDSIFKLDWAAAIRNFDIICSKPNCPLPTVVKDEITGLLADIEKFHISGEENWFDRFTILILRALYNKEYNDVIIWLKCIEEAAWEEILLSQCGILWANVKSAKGKNDKLELKVVFPPQDGGSPVSCPAFIDAIAKVVNNDSLLREALQDYASIFIEEGSWKKKDSWNMLNFARNRLVHHGISAYESSFKILSFLGIDPSKLDHAIIDLQKRNLEGIMKFERDCMNNKFFKPLRTIARKTEATYLPYDRYLCGKYIKALHGA